MQQKVVSYSQMIDSNENSVFNFSKVHGSEKNENIQNKCALLKPNHKSEVRSYCIDFIDNFKAYKDGGNLDTLIKSKSSLNESKQEFMLEIMKNSIIGLIDFGLLEQKDENKDIEVQLIMVRAILDSLDSKSSNKFSFHANLKVSSADDADSRVDQREKVSISLSMSQSYNSAP